MGLTAPTVGAGLLQGACPRQLRLKVHLFGASTQRLVRCAMPAAMTAGSWLQQTGPQWRPALTPTSGLL